MHLVDVGETTSAGAPGILFDGAPLSGFRGPQRPVGASLGMLSCRAEARFLACPGRCPAAARARPRNT